MKPRGRHPDKSLSAVRVRALKEPGRHADCNGLYLVVEPSGAKRWVLRTVVRGKRRDIGLGGLSLVPLAEAREKALVLRKLAREGGDPLAERRKAQAVIPSFAEAAERVHAEHEAGWRNRKHALQWIATLRRYAFPLLGERRVDQVDTPDVLKVLAPIWLTKPETARRVRQRVGSVLDWAKAAGFRSGENPVDGVAKGLPRQGDRDEHHAAVPYELVPEFVLTLRASPNGEAVRLAFEFLILTAARTGEVLGARWGEVDLDAAVWTVPAERMKGGRAHRVPLAPRAVAILRRVRELGDGSGYVFPGRVEAALEHGLPDGAAAHGAGRHGPRVPVVVPGLDRRAHRLPERGLRDGAGAHGGGPGGGGVPARGPVRETARADGRAGGVRHLRGRTAVTLTQGAMPELHDPRPA
jgi:integrase